MRAFILVALFAAAVAVPVDHVFHAKSQGELTCVLCQDVVKIAEQQLTSNATEQAIKNAIDQACTLAGKYVPGAAAICQEVEDNVDQIIRLLESEATPEEICKLINLCENTAPVVQAPSTLTDNCETCEQIVSVVESLIQKNSTEQEIAVVVGEACGLIEKYLPQVKPECDFVKDNIATIIGLITSEVSPAEVCGLIGQCSAKSKNAVKSTTPPRLHMPFDNCDVCKEMVQLVEGELEQNATVAELKQLVNQTCTFVEKYIPQIDEECRMVEDNLLQIIDYLVNQVTPEEACTMLGVCQSKAVSAILKAAQMKHFNV